MEGAVLLFKSKCKQQKIKCIFDTKYAMLLYSILISNQTALKEWTNFGPTGQMQDWRGITTLHEKYTSSLQLHTDHTTKDNIQKHYASLIVRIIRNKSNGLK